MFQVHWAHSSLNFLGAEIRRFSHIETRSQASSLGKTVSTSSTDLECDSVEREQATRAPRSSYRAGIIAPRLEPKLSRFPSAVATCPVPPDLMAVSYTPEGYVASLDTSPKYLSTLRAMGVSLNQDNPVIVASRRCSTLRRPDLAVVAGAHVVTAW